MSLFPVTGMPPGYCPSEQYETCLIRITSRKEPIDLTGMKGLVRAESLEDSVFFMTRAEAGWRSNSN